MQKKAVKKRDLKSTTWNLQSEHLLNVQIVKTFRNLSFVSGLFWTSFWHFANFSWNSWYFVSLRWLLWRFRVSWLELEPRIEARTRNRIQERNHCQHKHWGTFLEHSYCSRSMIRVFRVSINPSIRKLFSLCMETIDSSDLINIRTIWFIKHIIRISIIYLVWEKKDIVRIAIICWVDWPFVWPNILNSIIHQVSSVIMLVIVMFWWWLSHCWNDLQA